MTIKSLFARKKIETGAVLYNYAKRCYTVAELPAKDAKMRLEPLR